MAQWQALIDTFKRLLQEGSPEKAPNEAISTTSDHHPNQVHRREHLAKQILHLMRKGHVDNALVQDKSKPDNSKQDNPKNKNKP